MYGMKEAVSASFIPHQQDIIPYVVKNLGLAVLKMGRSLPVTC
jgi:hypothetical protein